MAAGDPDLVIRVAANIESLKADMAAAAATLKAVEAATSETHAATTHLTSSVDDLGHSWVGRVTEGLMLRDAMRELLSVAKEIAIGIPEEAKALRNLSLQTQINVEDLQVLTAATREYGVEGDQLGRALFQLGQRIAGGDANVATAYHLMGLSLDEVKNKSPLDLLLTTEHALGTLSGAIQDTAAKDLYGARLGASMIAFAHGADEAMDKAKALNTIASRDSVLAAAEYADAIDRMTHSLHAWVMEITGSGAMGFNTLHDAVDKGASKWAIFLAILKDAAATENTGAQSASNLATLLDRQATSVGAAAAAHAKLTAEALALDAAGGPLRDGLTLQIGLHNQAAVALTAQQQAARFMAATELDSSKPLLAWQVEYLGHLKEIGLLTAQNAAGIGVTVDQLKKYEAGLQEAKKAAAELAKAEAEADAIEMTLYAKRSAAMAAATAATLKYYSFEGPIANLDQLKLAEESLAKTVFNSLTSAKDRMKVLEELAVKEATIDKEKMALEVKHAGLVDAQVAAELTAKATLLASYGQQADGTLQMAAADRTLELALDALHAKKQAGVDQFYQEQALYAQYVKDVEKATAAQTALQAAIVATTAAKVASTFSLTGGGRVPDKFKDWTTEMLRNAGYIDLYGKVTPLGQENGFGYSARATGGPVNAGQPYLVGERGPELFVPGASGSIVPNGAVGGGATTIQIYVTQPLGTPQQIAAIVGPALVTVLKGQGWRAPSGA
jgi:hypothetical protein